MTKTFKIAILLTIESPNTAEEVEQSVKQYLPSVGVCGVTDKQFLTPDCKTITITWKHLSSQFSTFEINPRSRG